MENNENFKYVSKEIDEISLYLSKLKECLFNPKTRFWNQNLLLIEAKSVIQTLTVTKEVDNAHFFISYTARNIPCQIYFTDKTDVENTIFKLYTLISYLRIPLDLKCNPTINGKENVKEVIFHLFQLINRLDPNCKF